MAKVTLLAYTPEPEKTVAAAAKLCYSPASIETVMDGLTEEKTASFVQMLAEIGHESPIEHASFTFGLEGVSRSLLSKNVEEAVRAGYIETAQDEKDRRVVRLRLTQRAQEAAGRCRAIRKDFYGSVCAGIDGESLKVCLQVLQQMWKNITGMMAQTEGAASCGKGDR